MKTDPILKELNSYNKNTRFIVNHFINEDLHILDINIHQNNTDTYHKDMHTGQYIHYCSQTPWKLKTSCIKGLYHRAHKICSNKHVLDKQTSKIKTFISWNGNRKRVQTNRDQ